MRRLARDIGFIHRTFFCRFWVLRMLRRQAQAFVEGNNPGHAQRLRALEPKFRPVIETGRESAVAASQRVLATLQSIDLRWHRVLEAGGLVLLLP